MAIITITSGVAAPFLESKQAYRFLRITAYTGDIFIRQSGNP